MKQKQINPSCIVGLLGRGYAFCMRMSADV